MTDGERTAGPANAELADAVDSIKSTGEDWRSSERGDGAAATRADDDDEGDEEEREHG